MITTIIGYWVLINYTALQLVAIIGIKRFDRELQLRITIASGFALVTAAICFR